MAKTFENSVPVFTADQVRNFDRIAIAELEGDGYKLMEQAGEAAFAALLSQWSDVRRLVVVCGSGNNGGDGYVLARLAHQHDLDVQVLAATPTEKLRGSAKQAMESAIEVGVRIESDIQWPQFGIVVDGLLGIGLTGPVSEAKASIIKQINRSGLAVLSLDIPSGLNPDTGIAMGCAVKSLFTISSTGALKMLNA